MKWIDVKDSLPKVNYDVLLYISSGAISTGYLSKRRPIPSWTIHNEEEQNFIVMYWMPLPRNPS